MLLPEDYRPEPSVFSHFRQQLGYTLQSYDEKNNAISCVKSILNLNGIRHLFVKGASINKFYPVAEFRTSGDIDVIVDKNNLDNVFNVFSKSDEVEFYSRSSDTLIFKFGETNIEIHNNADVCCEYFDNIFSLCSNADNYTYELDRVSHLLYIICHMSKHLKYRGAGIRMLMDIDVMVRNINDFNQSSFLDLCEKADRRKSAEVLLSLSALWFDTPLTACVDFNNDSILLENLEKIIIDGGSFGYKINSVPVSYFKDTQDKDGKISLISKIKIILKMAFPNKAYLLKCYPYAEKHRWLYPAARLNRLWDGLFKKRRHVKNVVSQVSSGSEISKVQQELIKELNISD